jgi:hypothetical protein
MAITIARNVTGEAAFAVTGDRIFFSRPKSWPISDDCVEIPIEITDLGSKLDNSLSLEELQRAPFLFTCLLRYLHHEGVGASWATSLATIESSGTDWKELVREYSATSERLEERFILERFGHIEGPHAWEDLVYLTIMRRECHIFASRRFSPDHLSFFYETPPRADRWQKYLPNGELDCGRYGGTCNGFNLTRLTDRLVSILGWQRHLEQFDWDAITERLLRDERYYLLGAELKAVVTLKSRSN